MDDKYYGRFRDQTQIALMDYLEGTEIALEELIKTFDPNGKVKIIPSIDLGMPNNLIRLYGGFATGMAVLWKCNRPIVFIDATVNSCVSSYFELDVNDAFIENFTTERIYKILQKQNDTNHCFNIKSGNHFISLCKSRMTGKIYLVQHFSDGLAKDVNLGLYPTENVWYRNNMQIFNYNDRCIRYLIDASAEKFYKCATELEKLTKEDHLWLAKEIAGDHIVKYSMMPHYGMPKSNVIIIGTFFCEDYSVVPIFSKEACPIYLFQPSKDMEFVRFEDYPFVLIPHGWGQKFIEEYSYTIKCQKKMLKIYADQKLKYQFDIESLSHLPDKIVNVRTYKNNGQDFFYLNRENLKGKIVDILDQKAALTRLSKGVEYYE